MGGPIPNRSSDLSRERSANRPNRPDLVKGVARDLTIPKIPRDWHPTCKLLWNSALSSGQIDYWQDSDLAILYTTLEDLHQIKSDKMGRGSGVVYESIMKVLLNLCLTEGERRRARIELERPEVEGEDAAVVAIASYREALGIAKSG